jgi:hypothetical protein
MSRERKGTPVWRAHSGALAILIVLSLADCAQPIGECDVMCPTGERVDTSVCACVSAGDSGAAIDASYAEDVEGGLVLTGCPVGPNTSPFNVDIAHGGVPPIGSCDLGTTCAPTTTQRCSGGQQGAIFQWDCSCADRRWDCKLTGQSMGGCPAVVQCDGSICAPGERCTSVGRCCPIGANCIVEIVDAGGE